MANNRDVNLVIRARDEAKKTLNGITAALGEFALAQNTLNKSAGQTNSLLGKLSSEYAELAREVQGLAVLSKLAGQMDSLNAAFSRNQAAVQRSKETAAGLVGDYGRMSVATAKLRKESDLTSAALERQKSEIEATRDALAKARDTKSPAAKSFAVFETAELKKQRAELAPLKVEAKEAAAAFGLAQRQQESLKTSATRATLALRDQRGELARTGAGIAQASASVSAVQAAFGNVALDQASIAAAAARAAGDLQKVNDALLRQKSIVASTPEPTGPAAQSTVAYRNQVQAVRDAEVAWREAKEEANKLGAAIRNTTAPTREMQTAFALAQAASRAAKEEYLAQAVALNEVRGATKGTFAAFQQTAAQIGTVARSAQQATGGLWQLGPPIRDAGRQAGLGSSFFNAFGASLGAFGSGGRQALSLTQRLRGELLALTTSFVGLYAAFNQIGEITDAFKTVEAVESRLGVVFNQDTGRIAQEVARLRSEAIRLGISFEVLGDTFSKFAVATSTAGFELSATRYIFTSVAEAARVNKTSVEGLRGVFLALEQMISKGKVSSEELRRQLGDRMAGAFALFAAGLKMTTAELDAAMRKGEIFSTDTTMLAFADELNKRFGSQLPTALESLTTQMARFQALIFDFRVQVAKAGFAEELRDGINDVNEALQSTGGAQFAKTLGSTLGTLASTIAVVVNNFDLLIDAGQLFVSVKLASAFGGLIVNIRAAATTLPTVALTLNKLSASATTLRASFVGLTPALVASRAGLLTMGAAAATIRGTFITLAVSVRGLWAALGGLPGLILTGLSFALTGFVGDWLTGVDKATEALDKHDRIVSKVRDGYVAAKGDVDKWASSIKDLTAFEVQTAALEDLKIEAEALAKIKSPDEGIFAFGNDLRKGLPALKDAVNQFRDGTISAEEFREKISEVGRTDPQFTKGFIQSLIDASREAEGARDRINKYSDILKVMDGTAGETATANLGLADSMDEVTRSINEEAFEGWRTALTEIKELIPELTGELKLMKDQAKLDDLVASLKEYGPLAAETIQLIAKAQNAINLEAVNSTIKGGLVDKIVGAESSGNANAKNPLSSATGLGQFIEGTWEAMFRKYFPDRAEGMTREAILALRTESDLSRKMIELYAQENAALLQKAGIAVTDASLYLAHFLGPQGAMSVLAATPSTPIEALLSSDAIKSNPGVLDGKTAGEVLAYAQQKVGITERELALNQEMQKIEQARKDDAADFIENLNAQNDERRFEIESLAETARQQAVLKAVREQELAAKKAGVELTKQQRDQVASLAALQFDAANKDKIASENKQAIETAVNDLLERRKMLMEQIEFYEGQGQAGAAGELRPQLEATNAELQKAIENAYKFYEALGGAEAVNAKIRLDGIGQSISAAANKLIFDGKQINDLIVNGLSNAFDSFSQKIAEGVPIVEALKDSFLQFAADFLREIAMMIAKQAILNALGAGEGGGSGGAGGFIAGVLGGLFHSGGIAGSAPVSRRVSPAWFANAVRYHEGGLAGLKPGEVPAILKRNEEILTEDNPRHIANAGQGSSPMSVKVVNAIDAGSFISEGLNSTVGERSVLNFITSNRESVRSALGV